MARSLGEYGQRFDRRSGTVRKLSKTIAVMGLLAPLGASALGVGDIRLHSGLNQALNAEIPLVLSGADSLSDVKVSLAGPEAFAKAGLDRQYFLTKLQFRAIQKPNGQYAIQVSSREVMREPFLSFLVEVNWPQGRVLREFTALLDPPASLPDAAVAETTPPVLERPYRSYPRERVAEISRVDEAPSERRPSRRISAAAPRREGTDSAPSANQMTNDAYGPVQRGETLWSIANALARDSSASPEQLIQGLYRANPQAFAGNADSLRAGTLLRIPTSEYLAQVNPRRGSVRRAARNAETFASGEDQNQLRLLSPAEAKSRGESAAGGATGGASGKAKGDLALEVAETAKQENEEFRSRLIQLERKLGDMERMLSLKDEQIAALQAQQRSVQQSFTAKPVAPPVPPVAPLPVPPPETPAVTAPPASIEHQPTATVQPPAPTQPAQPHQPAVVKPPEPPVAPAATTTPPPPRKPAVPRPVAPPPAEETAGFPIDSDYLIAGGGLALLGLGAWLVRRRRNAMIAETESILMAAERESLQTPNFSAARAMDSGLEPIVATKSSFLSEFTPSDFDALGTETDDVDPISEADVYLAYGRYKQAEELIRHAIAQRPERDESKLKLLEIYYATENRSAFESYAKELKAAQKDKQPDFWSKVEEMGRELVPNSSLFEAPGSRAHQKPELPSDAEYAAVKGFGALDLSDDLIDDLKRFEIEFVEPASREEENLDPLAFRDTGRSGSADSFGLGGKDKSHEFDIESLYLDEAGPDREDEVRTDEVTELENLISFDFGKTQEKSQEKPASSPSGALFDDILRDLGSRAEDNKKIDEPAPTAGFTVSEHAAEKPAFDLDLFETDTPLPEKEQSETRTEDTDEDVFAELTDMDQCETKLDLAKAYADMGDEHSAREILQEVFASGSERQQAEASALLNKMGQDQADSELSLAEPKASRM